MNRFFYNLFLHTVAAPFLVAYYTPQVLFRGKYRRSLGGKLGRLPEDFFPEKLSRPRIWLHAVSVGEVKALAPLVRALRDVPSHPSVIISTGTETGQLIARETINNADGFFYLPLDFPGFVNRVVERIRPDLFVLMETELWPNLVYSLKKIGCAVALANGRISDRSFPRYLNFRRFFVPTLELMDLFLMMSQVDAQRIIQMGAPETRVRVTGNTKFDAVTSGVDSATESRMREMLDLSEESKVLVAGSTHPGEHEIVLDAYGDLSEEFPDLILVIVPRHVEKTSLVLSSLRERGMGPVFFRSSIDSGERRNKRKIVLWDRTGELCQVFSVASVVFMGGSLVPKGGQNILEPAAWGKTVIFGPSMEDFRDAREILLKSGAGIEVHEKEELAGEIRRILAQPSTAAELGAKGRQEVLRNTGSALRNAEILEKYITVKQKD